MHLFLGKLQFAKRLYVLCSRIPLFSELGCMDKELWWIDVNNNILSLGFGNKAPF